jgi:hypothetical protein
MTLGAEPKKVAILGALVVIAAIGLYMNSTDEPAPAPRSAAKAVASTPSALAVEGARGASGARVRGPNRLGAAEFRPRLGPARGEKELDLTTIDPELRLDLLAKVQAIQPIEAGRNLFQFGAAPAPKEAPAPIPVVPKIPVNQPPPPAAPPVAAGPPVPLPPPPITLKYYGYQISKTDGHKVAFLLDGDDILMAGENQTVKQRYRIVSIALKSIIIEDTQGKSTQTLPLVDLPG